MSRTKKSLLALLLCYLIWGLQPLYWNLLGQFDALFVLCGRIVMSAIFTWLFLICTGRLKELLATFRNRALMKYLVPAAVFICADWGLYNWAVMNGHVLDVSLGYYMNPMVMFIIGLVLFRERGHLLEYISVGVATLGVLISTVQYGSFPIVAVLCAFSWPLYATVKKAANSDPIISIAVETTLLTPFAIIASIIFFRGEGGMASIDLSGSVLLVLSGIVAATPMILYTYVVNDLPFKAWASCSTPARPSPSSAAYSSSTRARRPPSSSCSASSSSDSSSSRPAASNGKRRPFRTTRAPNDARQGAFFARPALFLCCATAGC